MSKEAQPMIRIVNEIIKTGSSYGPTHDNYVNPNDVSDGYHTFGELYEHRVTLFIALCREYDDTGKYRIWRSKRHSDGTGFEGWFIMGIYVDIGMQISYHLPLSKWDETSFARELANAPEWDGHTSQDVISRLKTL